MLNRIYSNILIFAVLIFMSSLMSCGSDDDASDAVVCSSTTISFTSEVLPIINSSCATSVACHASGSTRGPGALTNYSQVFASRAQISSSVKSGRMPQGSTLSSDQKSKIICWIEAGAANN